MAQATKEVKVGTIFLNKGLRHYDLGVDKSGKTRRHSPGTTMEYTAEETERHAGYSDLIDVSKIPGRVDSKKLEAEKNSLKDENVKLKAQLAALEAKPSKAKADVKLEGKNEGEVAA